jgi:flagellar hook-associated protein 1 FlgK
MGLTQALSTSLAGLNATQTGLSVIAGNVANAQTPGYVAQSATQIAVLGGEFGNSVRVTAINRMLDTFVQQQLRTETSGGAYADMKANFYQQLQQVYGQPGSGTAFDATFNNFTSAVQALATSPNSPAAQSQTISAAQAFAAQLNSATTNIQSLRSQADQGIASDVQVANNALQQIATINQQLQSTSVSDSSKATLEDQRDQYIDQLSKLFDIRTVKSDNDVITVFTTSGTQLVGTQAAQLQFSATGSITAAQQWNSNPAQSGLSSITLLPPGGGSIDLVANGAIRSGEIGAYLNMRDNVLVQAQTQIDAIAAQMSSALSDTTTPGTATSVGAQNGFLTDLGGMLAGNTTQVTYTDSSNVQHTVSIVRVNDPTALPLSNAATTDPNDTVVGVDFSGGMASVVTQLNTALGATGLQFSNPSGTTLQVLDSGPGTITVNSVATTTTATTLSGGSGALPFFVDAGAPYSGAITAAGSQSVGYAGRIQVNAALVADPTKLVSYQANTPVGDTTRPNFIYDQLTNATLQFSAATGIGSASSPYQGTLSAFLSQVVSTQSLATTAANNLQAGQDIVVNALQTRFNQSSAVNIDTEMANLLTLQNNYGANARVMATVKAMLDVLMQM